MIFVAFFMMHVEIINHSPSMHYVQL